LLAQFISTENSTSKVRLAEQAAHYFDCGLSPSLWEVTHLQELPTSYAQKNGGAVFTLTPKYITYVFHKSDRVSELLFFFNE